MINKIFLTCAFFAVLGCTNRKKLVEKQTYDTTIQKVSEEKKAVSEIKQIDSTKVKKVEDNTKHQNSNLHIEFNPKINDSLEVHQIIGTDSLFFKVYGNGKVTLNLNTNKIQAKKETTEILGSKTLYNLDSAVQKKEDAKINSNIKTVDKQVKSTGFTFSTTLIIGVSIIVLIVLFFLYKKFGGGLLDKFKNFKI
jgi:hypothetical protein